MTQATPVRHSPLSRWSAAIVAACDRIVRFVAFVPFVPFVALTLAAWSALSPSTAGAQSPDAGKSASKSSTAAKSNAAADTNATQSAASNASNASEESEAVKAGRKALRTSANFPWYDASKDELSRLKLPKEPEEPAATNTPTNVDWSFPDWFVNPIATLIKVGIYLLMAVLLGLIVFLLVRAYLKYESRRGNSRDSDDEVDLEGDADRMEALPFPVARPRGDLLSEARRLYEAGDYAQAIIYLFSYQLVMLDRHQAIELVRGKTNRQYLQELRPQHGLSAVVTHTMLVFEDVFFGKYPLERKRFEACWSQLDEFHQMLQKAGTA